MKTSAFLYPQITAQNRSPNVRSIYIPSQPITPQILWGSPLALSRYSLKNEAAKSYASVPESDRLIGRYPDFDIGFVEYKATSKPAMKLGISFMSSAYR